MGAKFTIDIDFKKNDSIALFKLLKQHTANVKHPNGIKRPLKEGEVLRNCSNG